MFEGERRLAAIMYTDIVGYTSLAQKDESSTLQALEKHRSLLRPLFASHGGREIKTIGDSFLIEFQSALDAVLCAIAVQQMMHDRKVARGEQLSIRIGIHVGDVVESGNDILGDAVNVASRIEPLADPGGICISSEVYDHVRNKIDLPLVSLGEKILKNVSIPVAVYKVQMPWEQSVNAEALVYPTNRIAILPFRNMSPDPIDEYFAEGMTEEIISTVSGISGLDVISRTSVMSYKGSSKRVEDIGRELKVGSVLEGSLRKAGNKIRVTTQLIEVAKDRHLWAQNYDRNLDDVFEVQSDVAKQVADALKVRILSPEQERLEKRPTENTTAYALYLQGRYLWNKRRIEEVKKAAQLFEQAVAEDPSFALGYVGQADCCMILRDNWGIDLEANLRRGRELIVKALELDPTLAEAQATEGCLLGQDYHFQESELELKKAIGLKPSYSMAHMWYSQALVCQLRWDEALDEIEKAVELDPLAPIVNNNHGFFYYFRRNYPRAVEILTRVVELNPDFVASHGGLAMSYGKMKKFLDMRRELDCYFELIKGSFPLARLGVDASAAVMEDDRQRLKELMPELERHFTEAGLGALDMAIGYIQLGETDKGFEWLERSYSRREAPLGFVRADPFFDTIRSDPRYLDLLKRLGLG